MRFSLIQFSQRLFPRLNTSVHLTVADGGTTYKDVTFVVLSNIFDADGAILNHITTITDVEYPTTATLNIV